jgi:hypothetical protein
MALYPGAYFVKIAWANKPRVDGPARTFGKVILHTAVSDSRTLEGEFKNEAAGKCSHFYVDKDGNVEQYIDTIYTSNADYQGNRSSISIETWDGNRFGTDAYANATPWTGSQVEALAKLIKWICATHDIPVRLMGSSFPGERGVGYHRLGIPGAAPPGAEHWSTVSKVCPGDARIAQIPFLLTRVGTVPAWSGPTPLRIDGSLGPATIRRWQQVMGTTVDGVISQPSELVRAVQRRLRAQTSYTNLEVDGYGIVQGSGMPTRTVEALQEYLGMPKSVSATGMEYYDGLLAAGSSATVRGVQIRLNKDYF